MHNSSFNSGTLDNGLTVITDHLPHAGGVSIEWVLRSGRRHEATPGAAHFLEHMICSSHGGPAGQEAFKYFETITPDDNYNLSTGQEEIIGFVNALPEYTEHIISTLGQIVSGQRWTQAALERERSRILSEYQIGENGGSKRCFNETLALAYQGHPLGQKILGTSETITAMSDEHLCAYMTEHLAAQRMALIISGPGTHDQNMRMAEEAFGSISRGTPTPVQESPVFHTGGKQVIRRREGLQTLHLSFEAPSKGREAQLLGSGYSLFQRRLTNFISENGLSYDGPNGGTLSFSDSGLMGVETTISVDKCTEAMEGICTLLQTPEEWLTEEEFRGSQLKDRTYYAFNMDSPIIRRNLISHALGNEGLILPPQALIERQEQITFDDVRAAWTNWAAKGLKPNVAAFGPLEDIPDPQTFFNTASTVNFVATPEL